MEQVQDSSELQLQLASRGSRLVAALIDSFVLSIFILPLMYFTGGFESFTQSPPTEPSWGYLFLLGILNFILFAIINRNLMRDKGQTIGKKWMKIGIRSQQGELPKLNELLFKRYAYYFLIGYVPLIGGVISLVGVLLIFGSSRRCLHDIIASTQVIRLNDC